MFFWRRGDPGDDADLGMSKDERRAQRFEVERMLMDADRMMMQAVNLSLSLIGFGFSLNAFFNEVASKGVVHADRAARQLGVALLLIGVLFLSMTIVSQTQYRRRLVVMHQDAMGHRRLQTKLNGRATPTFVTALLLLGVGLVAFGWIVVKRLF